MATMHEQLVETEASTRAGTQLAARNPISARGLAPVPQTQRGLCPVTDPVEMGAVDKVPLKAVSDGEQRLVASAINIEGCPKDLHKAAPEPGADTDEVLREAGFTAEQIESMHARNIV